MRRLSVLAAALLAIGCSSHSSAVPTPGKISPQIFQRNVSQDGWISTKIPDVGGRLPAPERLSVDSSQHVWVADDVAGTGGGAMSEISMNQSVTTFPLSIIPLDSVMGSDQNMWISSPYGVVARLTPQGVETDYDVAPQDPILHIISGPDGALWFTVCDGGGPSGGIGTITTAGVYTFFPSICPHVIASGPDGNIWYGDQGENMYNMTPQGVQIGKYSVGDVYFADITTGADGALYVSGRIATPGPDELVKVTMNGSVTHLGRDPYNHVHWISFVKAAPDGKLWLQVGAGIRKYLTTFDPATQTYSPTRIAARQVYEMIVGPDGNLWLSTADVNVWTYLLQAMTVAPKQLAVVVGQNANVNVSEVNYGGQWTAASNNAAVATVTLNSQNGTFVVTGVAPGTTKIVVSDSMFNSVQMKVTVSP